MVKGRVHHHHHHLAQVLRALHPVSILNCQIVRQIVYYIWPICYDLDFFLKFPPQEHFLCDREEGLLATLVLQQCHEGRTA